MRKVFLFLTLSLVITLSGLGAQTAQTDLHLRGKVLDSTQLPFAAAAIKVFRGNAEPREGAVPVKEGVSSGVGDFDIALPAGEYRIQVTAPDFNTFSQAVRLTANMQPLSVVLTVKEMEVLVEVTANSNEVGVDPDSSLTTDIITGEALLDLPENEEDLLEYLTNLAAARGISDGELNIRLDGFNLDGGRLPNRSEISEIRIVNTSFSADGNSSGPRIEIVTRPGTGFWTGNAGFSFNDESLNAAAPLTGNKPATQRRNFQGGLRGPILPGRITGTFDVRHQEQESEGNALRAVGINGPVNEGISRTNNSRNITFRPTLTINQRNAVNASFNYADNKSDNGGVGGLALPERAANSKGHNWTIQATETNNISNTLRNETRFQIRQNNSGNVPILSAPAINVTQSFQGGGAPNRSQNSSRDYLLANQFRWQKTRALLLTGSFELNYHKTDNRSENNYLGTYTFSSLHDYCYAEATVNGSFNGSECLKTKALLDAAGGGTAFIPGTTIAITGTPTQFTMSSGNPDLKVSQAELAAFLQGEWRPNTRAQISFGVRYQMQEHLNDYNNFAPTAGLAYQLSTKQGWQTVLRIGARMNISQFGIGTWEQLLRSNGTSSQTNIQLLSPAYPAPNLSAASTTGASSSLRFRADDYVSPYTIQPSLAIEQTLPKGHRLSVNFQMNRGVHQSRNRNINAPYPGTVFDEAFILQLNSRTTSVRDAARAVVNQLRPYFPLTSTINLQESVGNSLSKNLSIQYRVNNKGILGNKFQIGGNVTWALNWAEDDNNALNPYDLTNEWGRSGAQLHRLTSSVNLRVVRYNMQFSINPSWSSGRPYTITSGRDENGDGSSNDRAAGYKKNSETGPSTFGAISMTFRKTFTLTSTAPRPAANYAEPQRGGGGGGGGFGGGGGGGGGRGGSGARTLDFQVQVSNLFNSTIKQGINGNLSSPLFGQITSGGSGRTITLSLNTQLGRLF